jgi:tetratricopeptide (TPR) repeat protein
MSNAATALSLRQSGKTPEAAALCRRILAENPRDGEANALLSGLLLEAGQLADAEHYAKAAVVSDMRNPAYHIALSRVYDRQGNKAEAIRALDRALVVAPNDPEAFRDRVKYAFDDENYDTAERLLLPMIEAYPDVPDLLALLLHVRKEQKKYYDVVKIGDRILRLKPGFDDPQFFLRYAIGLLETGRLRDSITYHRHVLDALENDTYALPINEKAKAEITYNIALAHDNLGEFDAADTFYRKALAIDPEHHKCRFAWETMQIKISDLKRDLSSFSMRFLMNERYMRQYPWPEWKGEPLEGKRLLIWGEQGIGDVAMFAGFIPYVREKVSFLMIDMFPFLVPMFQRSFPGIPVAAFGEDFTPSKESLEHAFDYHAPMGSLMMFLLKDYKPHVVKGYLKPEPERTRQLRERYAALGPGLKVGISWRTVHVHTRFRRDIPLEQWGPIFAVPDCRFISLQYSNEEKELAYARNRFGVDILLDKDVRPLLDRDDFLAQIAAMDIVVSIQNSAVHMGGACGTDTILMLSKTADFRWGVSGERSVWYPSVRIVRQPEYGDWSPVIARVAGLLAERAKR